MKVDLIGKRALVTAGCAGIGRAIVEQFLASGATVAVCDISPVRDHFTCGWRVALVTEATGGIGRAIALTLADAGAPVFVGRRKPDGAKRIQDEIFRPGHQSGCDHISVIWSRHWPYRVFSEAVGGQHGYGSSNAIGKARHGEALYTI